MTQWLVLIEVEYIDCTLVNFDWSIIDFNVVFTESQITAIAPSLVYGEFSVQVPTRSLSEGNLVTTVKETISSPSYSRLIAEVEKQYVAITPPDSPEPLPGMVSHV